MAKNLNEVSVWELYRTYGHSPWLLWELRESCGLSKRHFNKMLRIAKRERRRREMGATALRNEMRRQINYRHAWGYRYNEELRGVDEQESHNWELMRAAIRSYHREAVREMRWRRRHKMLSRRMNPAGSFFSAYYDYPEENEAVAYLACRSDSDDATMRMSINVRLTGLAGWYNFKHPWMRTYPHRRRMEQWALVEMRALIRTYIGKTRNARFIVRDGEQRLAFDVLDRGVWHDVEMKHLDISLGLWEFCNKTRDERAIPMMHYNNSQVQQCLSMLAMIVQRRANKRTYETVKMTYPSIQTARMMKAVYTSAVSK